MSYEDLTAEILEDPTFIIVSDSMETIIDDAVMVDYQDYISWDIGNGQIVAYHNPTFGGATLSDGKIEELVRDQVTRDQQLRSIDLMTGGCRDVYIIKNDMRKLAFMSLSSDGFKERGIYILKNPSAIYPPTWKGGLFTGKVNPNDPGVWHKILRPLFEDITILIEAVSGKHPPLNFAIVPSSELNTVSKYEVRYMGLRLSKDKESCSVNTSYHFNKYNKSDGLINRIGLAIKLLMEFEPELKLTTGVVDLTKAIYENYLSPHPYVPSTLDDLSPSEIQKFTDTAEIPEYIPRDLDNVKTAYFIDQVSLIERLLGPITMSVYRLNDRLIYLFGDMHVPTGTVQAGAYVTLETFFDYFFHNSPLMCDLFLESYAFLNVPANETYFDYEDMMYNPKGTTNELGKIIHKYAECLGAEKRTCHKFGNVQFHNIDFRRIANTKYNLHDVGEVLIHTFEDQPTELSRFLDNRHRYGIILDALILGDLEGASEQFKILYQDVPLLLPHYETKELERESAYDKLGKQFANIPRVDEVREYFGKLFESLLLNTTPTEDDSHEERLKLLHEFSFKFEVFFMDAYAIGRMIKSAFLYSKNVIFVYAGAFHIMNYAKILEEIYQAEKVVNIRSNDKFIDISVMNRERIFRELTDTMFLE